MEEEASFDWHPPPEVEKAEEEEESAELMDVRHEGEAAEDQPSSIGGPTASQPTPHQPSPSKSARASPQEETDDRKRKADQLPPDQPSSSRLKAEDQPLPPDQPSSSTPSAAPPQVRAVCFGVRGTPCLREVRPCAVGLQDGCGQMLSHGPTPLPLEYDYVSEHTIIDDLKCTWPACGKPMVLPTNPGCECDPKLVLNMQCRGCLVQSKRCTVCKADIDVGLLKACDDDSLMRNLNKLPVYCPFCSRVVKRRELDDHKQKDCTERPCPDGCTHRGKFEDFAAHRKGCKFAPVHCRNGCGKEGPREEMEENHEKHPDKCAALHAELQRQAMERRLQDEADKRNRSIERTKKMFPDKNGFQKIQTQSELFVVSTKLLAQEHDSLLWLIADIEKGAVGPHRAIGRGDDGSVYLNVPARVFADILTWLEHASVPSNPTKRDNLLEAADSLGLQRLVEQLEQLRALDEGGVCTKCGRLAADVPQGQALRIALTGPTPSGAEVASSTASEGGARHAHAAVAGSNSVHDTQPGEGRYATLSDSHTPTNSIAPTSMPIDRRCM